MCFSVVSCAYRGEEYLLVCALVVDGECVQASVLFVGVNVNVNVNNLLAISI